MIFEKRYPDGTYYKFNYDLYNKVNNRKKREYTIKELNHPVYSRIREHYYKSPWLHVKSFKLDGKVYIVDNITFVYDTGFVLRLNYHKQSDKNKKLYRYIKNINSLKYLKLLKLHTVEIIA